MRHSVFVWFVFITLGLTGNPSKAQPKAGAEQHLEITTGPLATFLLPKTKVVRMTTTSGVCEVVFSDRAAERPWRPADVGRFKAELARQLGRSSPEEVRVLIGDRMLEEYVPPLYREKPSPRCGPTTAPPQAKTPLVERIRPRIPKPTHGLAGRHIVVWASHGWYYDENLRRWQWQRPRMFTTVEDLLTMSLINSYLIPMLERAGAVVISCRERDYQTQEVVVDDEDSTDLEGARGYVRYERFHEAEVPGFRAGSSQFDEGVNPHSLGKTHQWRQEFGGGRFFWVPRIPVAGDYAVYVSYAAAPDRASNARYRVRHTGGTSDFRVNQQMMGNMWVYLGTFRFEAGAHLETGSVELVADHDTNGSLSADAVKFGGGMGNIARSGQTSGYPRYAEGAWYWFQYAGADASQFYPGGKDEYTRDYASRPEFVNYLVGAPRGPANNRGFPGKGVPVDVAFALHTDAGIATGTVGTLAIYKIADEDKHAVFPDGRDRMLNRDLADLIQTQIVDDVHALYCSTWTRRELAQRDLAEVRRPNVPTALIELLSHQNYDDMKFMLDPRFKRDVARAIYKGILRFIATEYGYEATPTPLAPKLLGAFARGGKVTLIWTPTPDTLEPKARSTGFVVYRRVDNLGWDEGTFVSDGNTTSVELPILTQNPLAIESFILTALNEGGESLPSNELSVSVGTGKARALIVDAFLRIYGPAMESSGGAALRSSLGTYSREGVNRELDCGVADGWDAGLTGDQYDFDRTHAWVGENTPFNNAQPGHGASYGDLETTKVLGRPPDLTRRHGEAFVALQWGFDAVHADAVARLNISQIRQDYGLVDWILGEQRTILPPPAHLTGFGDADRMGVEFATWPETHREFVKRYLAAGGKLFVTGNYVATDLVLGPWASDADRTFLTETLRCKWITDRASHARNIVSASSKLGTGLRLHVCNAPGESDIYTPSHVGGIVSAAKDDGETWLRYEDTGYGAGVAAKSGNGYIVILAFPFECVTSPQARLQLLDAILHTP